MEIRHKQISMALFILMAYAMVSPMIVSAQNPYPVFLIDPATTTVSSIGQTFMIEVILNNVVGVPIWGYEYYLGYDPSVLEVVEIDSYYDWITWDNGAGTIYSMGFGIWYTGEKILTTITFRVTNLFFGEKTLDLYDTKLSDIMGYSRPHEVQDGTVIRPSPAEAMQFLITTIELWSLPPGSENSLTSKLDAAIGLFNQNNLNGAVHKLEDFINQVEAFRGKKLTNEQADYLVTSAQAIIDAIGG